MGDARTYYEEWEDAQIIIQDLKEKVDIMRNALEDLSRYDETPDRMPMIEEAKEALEKVDDLG